LVILAQVFAKNLPDRANLAALGTLPHVPRKADGL
jgi:hypothetical protein